MVDLVGAVQAGLAAAPPRERRWQGHLRGSEYAWALAFCIPYVALFLAFVAYPVAFGVWMGGDPDLYASLFADPIYLRTVLNTALFLGLAVNFKMVCALLLSGFFARRGWWVKALLTIFVLPWAMAAVPAFISIHWMLNGEYGLVNHLLYAGFGIDGPEWLTERWSALSASMLAHVWKSLPFWTLILLAGRLAIPSEILDAAKVDGAGGVRGFLHITLPLLANLYLICTLLATIFALGDYNPVAFVSGGGPANSTHILATLSISYAFNLAQPRLGVAAVLSALPVLLPLIVILMRKFRASQLQL